MSCINMQTNQKDEFEARDMLA